jgi:hypothetical protein
MSVAVMASTYIILVIVLAFWLGIG